MPPGPVHAVLLAAGVSRRFGDSPPKQLALVEGEALVRRTAKAALGSGVRGVHAVVGHRAEEVAEALAGLPVALVPNPDYREGKASSVRAGLAALPAAAVAALFLPCDQPLLASRALDRVLATFAAAAGEPIVRPAARGPGGRRVVGAPVLFPRRFFSELLELHGDAGGRDVLRLHPEAVIDASLESDLPLRDVDTPEELARLLEQALCL